MGTVLVTGGAGFVGAHLALGIKAAGLAERVLAFDNLHRRGSELNLARLREGGVDFVHGDIRQPADLDHFGAISWIIECSAEPSVQAGYTTSPRYLTDTNLVGSLHCFELARRHGAAILFLSTSRVYPIAALRQLPLEEGETRLEVAKEGDMPPGFSPRGISEAFPLEGARSLYGATKLASELLLTEYGHMYDLPHVINRCGIIAGPGQMGKVDQGVAVLWAARHLYSGKLDYVGFGGQGKQVRDMLHIDDLLRLVLRQMNQIDAINGSTFNVGGGPASAVSLLELSALCAQATGAYLEIGAKPETHPSDVPWYVTDNSAVEAALQWRPEHDVAGIVNDIVTWLHREEKVLRPLLA